MPKKTKPVKGPSEAALTGMLATIGVTDGAEIPREQWPLAEVLVARGHITLGAPRGPGGDWRRAELVSAGAAPPSAVEEVVRCSRSGSSIRRGRTRCDQCTWSQYRQPCPTTPPALAPDPLVARAVEGSHAAFLELETRTLALGAKREPVESMTFAEMYGSAEPMPEYGWIAAKMKRLVDAAARAGLAVIVDSDAVVIRLVDERLVTDGADLRDETLAQATVRVHGACGGGASRGDVKTHGAL